MALEVVAVRDQYRSSALSDFVESPQNAYIYENYYHHSFFEELNKALVASPNAYILDLACGNAIVGRKSLASISRGLHVTGVDFSKAMLLEAKRLKDADRLSDQQLQLVEADVTALPKDLGEFEVVVSTFLLAHAETRATLNAFFKSIALHLQPGGTSLHLIPIPLEEVKDGFVEKTILPLVRPDGSKVDIELFDFHWKEATYREAAEMAGLANFTLTEATISQQALESGSLTYDSLPGRVAILKCKKNLLS